MSAPQTHDDLQELLEAGRRAATTVPAAARSRLEERLAALPGWLPPHAAVKGPPVGLATAAKRMAAAKGVLLFLAGTGAGLATKDRIWPPTPTIETRVVEKVVEVDRPSPAATVPVAPSAAPPPVPPVVAATSPTPRPAPSTDAMLERERMMIETARTALVRGDAPGALAMLARHAAEFPNGRLAELREVLAIQALTRSGRPDEATTRGAEFRRRYPQSVYLSVIDDAAGTASP